MLAARELLQQVKDYDTVGLRLIVRHGLACERAVKMRP